MFDEIFFDSPSTYAVNFTATFPSGIVVWSVYYGLSVTRGVVTAGLQDGFEVANQTAGRPFPLQPAVTVRDDLDGVVTSEVGAPPPYCCPYPCPYCTLTPSLPSRSARCWSQPTSRAGPTRRSGTPRRGCAARRSC